MMRKARLHNRQPSALDSGLYAGDSDLILLWKAVVARLPQYSHRKGREGRKGKRLTAKIAESAEKLGV
jgi:hypothetical protein